MNITIFHTLFTIFQKNIKFKYSSVVQLTRYHWSDHLESLKLLLCRSTLLLFTCCSSHFTYRINKSVQSSDFQQFIHFILLSLELGCSTTVALWIFCQKMGEGGVWFRRVGCSLRPTSSAGVGLGLMICNLIHRSCKQTLYSKTQRIWMGNLDGESGWGICHDGSDNFFGENLVGWRTSIDKLQWGSQWI